MPRIILTVEALQERRIDLLTAASNAKTSYLRNLLARRIDSVQRELYTITKNPIYR